MGNIKNLLVEILSFTDNDIRHFGQCLFDAYGLSFLDDNAFDRAHHRFDAERGGDQGLYAGKPAVFAERFQIVEYKVSTHGAAESLQLFHDLGEGQGAFFLPLHDLHCKLGFPNAGGFRITDIDILFSVFLFIEVLSQNSAVVTAA